MAISCENCLPDIEYKCVEHRLENQCAGCNRTDQKLILTGMGIICKQCARKGGMIFV